jgi:Zn-dependent protease
MDESVHLGTIDGIRIGANWSLVLIFGLIAWSLAGAELPSTARGYSTAAYWVVGVATALGFYACLLAHELAHSVIARRNNMEVEGIVLYPCSVPWQPIFWPLRWGGSA